MPAEDWVSVKRTSLEISAEIWRGLLEAEGIEAILRGNKAAGSAGAVNELNLSWSNPLGGVEVLVRRDDETRAREILAEGSEEKLPRRPTPMWIQWGAAAWIAAVGFYLVVGATSNNLAGIVAFFVTFAAILALGRRRSL